MKTAFVGCRVLVVGDRRYCDRGLVVNGLVNPMPTRSRKKAVFVRSPE
jgi:hypothetical protein